MDFGLRCDAAIDAGDAASIEALCDELRSRDAAAAAEEIRSFLNYCLGNLYSAWSRIEGETADGWRSDQFPVKRSTATDHFRKALKMDVNASFAWHDQARTNLGNELAHQGRGIEALAYWKPRLTRKSDAGFVSALSRARELVWTSRWLNDSSHSHLFQYEACLQARELDARKEETDHPFVLAALGPSGELRELIGYGDAHLDSLLDWQNSSAQSGTEDDIAYREWCLKRRLFANPVNRKRLTQPLYPSAVGLR